MKPTDLTKASSAALEARKLELLNEIAAERAKRLPEIQAIADELDTRHAFAAFEKAMGTPATDEQKALLRKARADAQAHVAEQAKAAKEQSIALKRAQAQAWAAARAAGEKDHAGWQKRWLEANGQAA